MSGWRLLADVGGTNVRFARSSAPGQVSDISRCASADFSGFGAAMQRYLAERGGAGSCTGAAIGAAGPVDDNAVQLTNLPWRIDAKEIAAQLEGQPVRIFNDLEAVALALPELKPGDVRPIGVLASGGLGRKTLLAVNVGTGFGACAITPIDGGWRTVAGEAGHISLPGNVGLPESWPASLHSVEDVLSGKGVAALYSLLAGSKPPDASEVFARAANDRAAAETVQIVGRLLGKVAGDVALATGAWGGVFLTGSVAESWAAVERPDEFRRAFEDKGAMAARMARVPTAVITLAHPALVGLSYA